MRQLQKFRLAVPFKGQSSSKPRMDAMIELFRTIVFVAIFAIDAAAIGAVLILS